MKSYAFVLKPSKIHYEFSIRSKLNVLQVLLGITQYLLVTDGPQSLPDDKWEPEPNKIRLILYIDKMSRIFIYERDKIHSFYFPFSLRIIDEKCTLWGKNECQITNATCAVLESLFSRISENDTVENILDEYWSIAADFNLSKEDAEQYSNLIIQLLSFEPGYLRFDHDTEHPDVDNHPQDHFDINYTDGASFKFGLYSSLDDIAFIDVLKSNTPCFFLSPKKR